MSKVGNLCDTILVAEENKRLVEVDLLRGFFVASLVVIHLRLWPNLLMAISGGSKLWVSVDSGFFSLAGFLLGYLNRSIWFVDRSSARNKLLLRAIKLYLWSIFTTLVFTAWGNMLSLEYQKSGLWIVDNNLLELFSKTLSYQYVYGWADYLNYYTVYILLTPLFFYIISNFSVYIAVLLSFFVYIFHSTSAYFGLQIFFFLSMVVGFKFEEIRAWFLNISKVTLRKLDFVLSFIFLVTLLGSIFSVHYFESFARVFLPIELADILIHKNNVLNLYFDKQVVAIGRVLLWPIWMFGFYKIFAKFRVYLSDLGGGFLVKIGQNSLKVYLIHAFVIFPAPYFLKIFSIDTYIERTIFSAIILWIVYLITIRTRLRI